MGTELEVFGTHKWPSNEKTVTLLFILFAQLMLLCVFVRLQGWPTLKGYMAQWSLMTYLDVRRTCELLAYLGYHTAGTDNQLSAITVTKAQRSGGSKKRNTRTVFMGHVIGPPGVGKTTFCQGLLGRTVDVSVPKLYFLLFPHKLSNAINDVRLCF